MLYRPSLLLQLIDITFVDVEITFPVTTGSVCVCECIEADGIKTVVVESIEEITDDDDSDIFANFPAMYLKAKAVNKLVKRCFPDLIELIGEMDDTFYK